MKGELVDSDRDPWRPVSPRVDELAEEFGVGDEQAHSPMTPLSVLLPESPVEEVGADESAAPSDDDIFGDRELGSPSPAPMREQRGGEL